MASENNDGDDNLLHTTHDDYNKIEKIMTTQREDVSIKTQTMGVSAN